MSQLYRAAFPGLLDTLAAFMRNVDVAGGHRAGAQDFGSERKNQSNDLLNRLALCLDSVRVWSGPKRGDRPLAVDLVPMPHIVEDCGQIGCFPSIGNFIS